MLIFSHCGGLIQKKQSDVFKTMRADIWKEIKVRELLHARLTDMPVLVRDFLLSHFNRFRIIVYLS